MDRIFEQHGSFKHDMRYKYTSTINQTFYKENKVFKTQEMQFEAGRYILNEFGCMDGKRVQNFGKI